MSGVYGFYNCINPENTMYRLSKWNKLYGKENNDFINCDHLYIGCCLDHLVSTPSPASAIIEIEDSLYSIDAILYNRNALIDKMLAVNSNLISSSEPYSDEFLLASYISVFGINSLSDINGDFSGAIYSKSDNILTLFRNHMGTRPMFYYFKENTIVFSTDIRGITAIPSLDMSLNEETLFKNFAGYSTLTPTATDYHFINCVAPGGYITFDLSASPISAKHHIYWQAGSHKTHLKGEKEYIQRLRELITDAVKIRLETFKTGIGAELSGGLDSGAIDILINRLGYDCKYFSWSYSPEDVPLAEHDERSKIIAICEQENIHCDYTPYHKPSNIDPISKYTLDHFGQSCNDTTHMVLRNVLPPYTNTISIADTLTYFSEQNCKVIFSGHGGDEGVSHRPSTYELLYYHEYYHYLRYMWSATHGQKKRIIKTIKSVYEQLSNNKFENAQFAQNYQSALSSSFKEKMSHIQADPHYFFFDPVTYVRKGGSRNRLDNMAMYGSYAGIRYAVPFLDYRVIDYALSIPRHMYIKGTIKRYIYREAFKDLFPQTLYKTSQKRNGSYSNVENNADWFAEADKERHYFVKQLDRALWNKYINFEELDRWLSEGEPQDDASYHDFVIKYSMVLRLAMIENTIKMSRQFTDDL